MQGDKGVLNQTNTLTIFRGEVSQPHVFQEKCPRRLCGVYVWRVRLCACVCMCMRVCVVVILYVCMCANSSSCFALEPSVVWSMRLLAFWKVIVWLIRNAVRCVQWAQRGRESAVREPANPPLLLVLRDGRNGGQAQQYACIMSPDVEHALSSRSRHFVDGASATMRGGRGAT